MRNIKLILSYDGSSYKGWQFQENSWTVQAELERAIEKVFGKKHRVRGASRTDSGVHAKGQVANFKTNSTIPAKKIPLALNTALSEHVVVLKAEDVPLDFDSRFDAKEKCYKYYIRNTRHRDPFVDSYTWRFPYDLNVPLMSAEAKALIGRHDFKSFQASDKYERGSVRRVKSIKVIKKGVSVIVEIKGDGFLYNMVRNIVGTLVDIGRGYLKPGSMREILAAEDRTKAGPTAPAKGLFLIKVRY